MWPSAPERMRSTAESGRLTTDFPIFHECAWRKLSVPYARMTDRPYGRYDEVSYEPGLPSNRLELMLQQRRRKARC